MRQMQVESGFWSSLWKPIKALVGMTDSGKGGRAAAPPPPPPSAALMAPLSPPAVSDDGPLVFSTVSTSTRHLAPPPLFTPPAAAPPSAAAEPQPTASSAAVGAHSGSVAAFPSPPTGLPTEGDAPEGSMRESSWRTAEEGSVDDETDETDETGTQPPPRQSRSSYGDDAWRQAYGAAAFGLSSRRSSSGSDWSSSDGANGNSAADDSRMTDVNETAAMAANAVADSSDAGEAMACLLGGGEGEALAVDSEALLDKVNAQIYAEGGQVGRERWRWQFEATRDESSL